MRYQQQSQIFIIMLRAATSKIAHQLYLRAIQPFSVRVRYAPSPTGFMHVGGLRTALFNYLFARKHRGQFIVRIQDTDKSRQVEGSLENIFETLEWVGAIADESIKKEGEFGPYIQSARLPLYKSIEKQLLKSNMAYPCFCKHDHSKEQQQQSFGYDGKCRNLPFEEIKTRILAKEEYAVRIKSDLIPLPKTFHDEVFGELEFKPLDDFVIVRSNGWPTFHLANVVDDWKMKITHVMRGEQWLSNTNKHIYLYRLLGAEVPKFVHLPLIKAMNGKKLAKRDPSSAVKFFQTGQYETQAVKCFLAQLGLNRVSQATEQQQQLQEEIPQPLHGKKGKANSKEKPDPAKPKQQTKKQQQNLKLLTDSQMVDQFDISRITKVPVKFDIKQLDFLNRLCLKKRWKVAQSIQSEMQYFIAKTHSLIPVSVNFPYDYIVRFLGCVVERFSFITDIALYRYYFQEPNYFDEEAIKDFQKIFGKNSVLIKTQENTFKVTNYDPLLYDKNKKIIHSIRVLLQHVIPPHLYNQLEILKKISEFLFQSPELKNQEVYHLLRFMISARKSGPNICQACEVIGREVILLRISAFSTL